MMGMECLPAFRTEARTFAELPGSACGTDPFVGAHLIAVRARRTPVCKASLDLITAASESSANTLQPRTRPADRFPSSGGFPAEQFGLQLAFADRLVLVRW